MRTVNVLLLLAALCVAVPLVVEAEVGSEDTCHNYACPTEYGFWKREAEWNPDSASCECVPYYKEGPCKDARCADGYITVEEDGECTCSWPCDGLHCQGPFVAMPDYDRKDMDNLCECRLPPRKKCHDEL